MIWTVEAVKLLAIILLIVKTRVEGGHHFGGMGSLQLSPVIIYKLGNWPNWLRKLYNRENSMPVEISREHPSLRSIQMELINSLHNITCRKLDLQENWIQTGVKAR